jgi:hypothetical protein
MDPVGACLCERNSCMRSLVWVKLEKFCLVKGGVGLGSTFCDVSVKPVRLVSFPCGVWVLF